MSVDSHATSNISRFKTIIHVDGTWRAECYFPLQETVLDSNPHSTQRNKSKELQGQDSQALTRATNSLLHDTV